MLCCVRFEDESRGDGGVCNEPRLSFITVPSLVESYPERIREGTGELFCLCSRGQNQHEVIALMLSEERTVSRRPRAGDRGRVGDRGLSAAESPFLSAPLFGLVSILELARRTTARKAIGHKHFAYRNITSRHTTSPYTATHAALRLTLLPHSQPPPPRSHLHLQRPSLPHSLCSSQAGFCRIPRGTP